MTEALRTAVYQNSGIKLPNKKRTIIKNQSTVLANREKQNGADPVFYDREIKKIRDTFCRSGRSGLFLWQVICDEYLKIQLQKEYENLKKLGIEYISIHNEKMDRYFYKDISWEDAISLCSRVGTGFSDSMILNALQSTSFPFAVTLDADLAYAVLADEGLKDIIMPDELIDNNMGLQKLLV